MTSTQQSFHMYVDSAIRFRDPFAVSKGLAPPSSTSHDHDFFKASSSANSRYQQSTSSTLTPPPDMTGIQHPATQPSYYHKEQSHYYDNVQQAYRAPIAQHHPPEVPNVGRSRNSTVSQSQPRRSPSQQSHVDGAGEGNAQGQPSQSNAIASNFQIPKSVNESGGSLAELAAQITCLFWFETSKILQQVEESAMPIQPTRNITADAKPTIGFLKWVTTILSTTMVAQNVVVLALQFIYRLKKMNPTVKGKPGSEYRLLTVALMLGNKFLDDNTYTNKTWAEVSGINVGEVHIMEVEFLSNMKYCLFTSEQDWSRWQTLLGRFAAFFERASRPLPPAPVTILPPASSLHLPITLPSPPASNQASPPYPGEIVQNAAYNIMNQHGPTPAPSPLGNQYDSHIVLSQPGSRKRSLDDYATEPPPKRIASGYQSYTSPQRYSTMPAQPNLGQTIPRLTLPSLSIPTSHGHSQMLNQQLPPLSVPARAMAMVYPATSSQGQATQTQTTAGPVSQSTQTQYQQRHQSPYDGSVTTSPTNAAPQSATALRAAHQISPTYFLQQRNSPYRPVHHVSTLLHPPPSAAIQTRPPTVELNQMQYQSLDRSVQHSGRLPYMSQNVWLDGNHPEQMTPIHQWPGMSTYATLQQQQPLAHQ